MSLAVVYSRIQGVLDEHRRQGVGGWLFERIGSVEPVYPMKPDDIIRASSVGSLCPRLETLCAKHDIVRKREIKPDLRWTFDVGTLTHHLYRDWYLGPAGMYRGSWKCLRCGWNTDGTRVDERGYPLQSFCPFPPHPSRKSIRLVKMPESCGGCGAPREDREGYKTIVFREWQLRNDEYGISGHTDGWRFDTNRRELLLQEIKSAAPSSFAYTSLNGPYPENKRQFQMYLWLTGFKAGEIVYINKAGKNDKGDPWDGFVKTHFLRFDRPWFKAAVLDQIKLLRECLQKGIVAEGHCSSPASKRARWCQHKELCFKEPENGR